MHFGFAAGWTGDCFYGSFSNPLPTEHSETQVYGTEGSIIVSWANLKVFRSDGSVEEHVFEHSNPFYNEFLNFYEAVVSDEPIVGTVAQSVKNMLIVLRALDSAEHGETLDLREEHWNVPATGVPLWRPRGAEGLFTGLPVRVTSTTR
jgi:predicted dehydrogenase